jgi:SsrA-binding protein
MKVINRKARFDYELLEKFEAGIALTGPEVKSAKEGKLSLEDSFVRIRNGEAWLHNAHIHPYRFADNEDYDPRRPRKLLLRRGELLKLAQKTHERGLTIVPVSCYTKGHLVKLKIALARGRKRYEKRLKIREREAEREIERELKNQRG